MKQFDFKKWNQEFFKKMNGITWYDKEGIKSLGDKLYVSFRLDDVSTVGNFNCYHVDLYSRTLGKLKSKTFFFRDYLTCPSISYDTSEKIFKFNRSSGTDYLPKPTEKEINSFIEEIEDYLDEIV